MLLLCNLWPVGALYCVGQWAFYGGAPYTDR